MRFIALACDYDGTLAHDGRVVPATVAALTRFKASGRKLILVTGRELHELLPLFPQVEMFDSVVAENGALLYDPATKKQRILAERPQEEFLERLRQRGVQPLAVGRTIVATWQPHEVAVLETIRDMGLELQVIFNKGAVMVLPAGVNKATGLVAALHDLALSPHNSVGVGDAENDHAFLSICECSAAVSNALPAVQEHVDLVTANDHGNGVVELIDRILANDLADLAPRLSRHALVLGRRGDSKTVRLSPYGENCLFAGFPSRGLPLAAERLLQRLAEGAYQFCALTCEAPQSMGEEVVVLHSSPDAPVLEDAIHALAAPARNVLICQSGLETGPRAEFAAALLQRLLELRRSVARPHWIVVDQADEVLLPPAATAALEMAGRWGGMAFVTSKPTELAPQLLAAASTVFTPSVQALSAIEGWPAATSDAKRNLDPDEVLMSRLPDREAHRVRLDPATIRAAKVAS